jgi:hypothetical protein
MTTLPKYDTNLLGQSIVKGINGKHDEGRGSKEDLGIRIPLSPLQDKKSGGQSVEKRGTGKKQRTFRTSASEFLLNDNPYDHFNSNQKQNSNSPQSRT